MTGRKRKSSPALGDDPLSWLKEDKGQEVLQQAGGKTARQKKPGQKKPGQKKNLKPSTPVATSAGENNQAKDNRKDVTIMLDPVITLAEVNDLKASLLGYINAGHIRIDAGKVEHIDTGGLQLLLAFLKTAQKRGIKISWQERSGALMNTAELLGLAGTLDMAI